MVEVGIFVFDDGLYSMDKVGVILFTTNGVEEEEEYNKSEIFH